MKKIILLACIFLLTFQVHAQKEPANNDQKIKDSAMQQTTQSSTASTHLPLKDQELIMIAISILVIVGIVMLVRKSRKR